MPDDQENPTDAPARTRLAPDDRRQQLVETAAAILGSEGVEQVRVPRVADEAGVSRPVVYRFFPNRHALILAVLEDCGVPYESLDVDACVTVEPALARVAHKLAGGLRLPLDETGDCYRFTEQLSTLSRAQGVEFLFGIDVERLLVNAGRITAVRT